MSKLSKRAIPILLIITLLTALIPVFPASSQIPFTFDKIWNESAGVAGVEQDWGYYDDELHISGDGMTAGETVKIGWDGLKTWDGEKGILNSTTAKGSGAWKVWIDVPEADWGDHFIWVKDMETGDTYMYGSPFGVRSKIKFSTSTGLVTDKITLYGYGFDAEDKIVDITFQDKYLTALTLTTTPLEPESDELGSWECTFKVPHAEYSPPKWDVSAKDKLDLPDNLERSATAGFTIGPSITVDPEEGPVGTVIEIEGRGFTPGEIFNTGEVTIYLLTESVTCKIIKEDTVGTDGLFKIEVVIPQTKKISDDYKIKVLENDPAVPLAVPPDPANTASDTDGFETTGLAEIELDPEYGVQGTTVSIEGWNFTQMSGEDIMIELWTKETPTFVSDITDKLDTESNGEFSGTFTAPAEHSEVYQIRAAMDAYNIEAFATFQIGLMIVIPSPKSGPTGTQVILSGTGFTAGNFWNATFGDITIVADTAGDVDDDTDLLLDTTVPKFYVPTVDPGTYTISVYDIGSKIAVDIEWTVTATTMVEFDPTCAPNKYNVSITGSYFNADSKLEDVDLEFVLYNVTDEGEADYEDTIDVKMLEDPGVDAELNEDGNFTAWWVVLESDTLSCGEYILNVTATDVENIMAQGHFTVCPKSITVNTRKTSFARGETVAFDIWSSFTQHLSYIEIYDPTGDLYWTTDQMTDGTKIGLDETVDMWLKVGELQTVPYYYQTAGGNTLLLLEDAPTGTWGWEWYDKTDDELDSGTFKVTAAAADVLSEQLTELSGDLADIAADFASVSTDVGDLASDVSSLSDSVAQAIAAANAASDAVQDVAAAVASVADTAANAATAATSAAAAATSAKEAADTAGAAASGLTNLVYGAIVASLVAALAAIVSLMQISKKIA